MDPTETLKELLDSILQDDDDENAQQRALALYEWANKGGFLPDLSQLNFEQQKLVLAFIIIPIKNRKSYQNN